MLKVIVEDSNDAVVLHCNGNLTQGEEIALVCPAIQRFGREIVVDMEEVHSIDRTGMAALITLQASGLYLKLRNLGVELRKVFRAAQLDSVFEIEGEQRVEPALNKHGKIRASAALGPAVVAAV